MTSLFDRYLIESDISLHGKNATPELNKKQKCLKITILIANSIFLIFSFVLMGLGSVALKQNVGPLVGTTLPLGLVTLGVFIMFMSILGCVGAWRENRGFLGCYFFLAFIVNNFVDFRWNCRESKKESSNLAR